MFGKCAKNKRTWWTWESKPWTWEQQKIIQLMNIVMCQKQAKTILVIHSCAFWGRIFFRQRKSASRGSKFLGSGETPSWDVGKCFPWEPYL
jgi:hypothetical protein